MKHNNNKQVKKGKNKEKKKKKNIINDTREFNDDNNEIFTDNEREKESKNQDKNWIMMLEEQMNKYEVESSSFENTNSDSEENPKDIKEIEKDDLDSLKSNKKIIEKENKKTELKKSIISDNNNHDSKNNIINLMNLDIKDEDRVVYDGREFINIKKFNKNYDKKKKKKIIYKCKNNRKDEKLRIETNQNPFCEATLEYIEPGQNIKSGYFLKKPHSAECDLLESGTKNINILEAKKYEDKKIFIAKYEELMNNSKIYDR